VCDERKCTFPWYDPGVILRRPPEASEGIAAELDHELRRCDSIVVAVRCGNWQEEGHPAWSRRSECRGCVPVLELSLEESRSNAAQSRNQRLAALRTFFEYIGQRFPERLGQAQKVAAIPRKRAQPPDTIFLERDEIEDTLAALPADGRYALRDRALLVFLYNTGARVQEAADLRASDVHFDPTPRVHLHGKGDKWRACPLWEETSALLKKLLSDHRPECPPDRPVFIGVKNEALTRFGIYKIIRRHTAQVVKKGSDGQSRRVSPHVWRHTTAVHLLEAGVEVNVIRAWLGHASLETTNRYSEITLRTKQAALEKCTVPSAADERIPRKPLWRTDAALLSWLQSL
jgi:integrase/recombinase XerD